MRKLCVYEGGGVNYGGGGNHADCICVYVRFRPNDRTLYTPRPIPSYIYIHTRAHMIERRICEHLWRVYGGNVSRSLFKLKR